MINIFQAYYTKPIGSSHRRVNPSALLLEKEGVVSRTHARSLMTDVTPSGSSACIGRNANGSPYSARLSDWEEDLEEGSFL